MDQNKQEKWVWIWDYETAMDQNWFDNVCLLLALPLLAAQNWSPSSWENILQEAFQTVFKIYKLYIKTKPSAFVLFVLYNHSVLNLLVITFLIPENARLMLYRQSQQGPVTHPTQYQHYHWPSSFSSSADVPACLLAAHSFEWGLIMQVGASRSRARQRTIVGAFFSPHSSMIRSLSCPVQCNIGLVH